MPFWVFYYDVFSLPLVVLLTADQMALDEFVLCVEKDLKGKWQFEKFDYYKSISCDYLNDNKFMNSFKRYSANDNSFYGFIRDKGVEYGYSASQNTNCYKIAASIVS